MRANSLGGFSLCLSRQELQARFGLPEGPRLEGQALRALHEPGFGPVVAVFAYARVHFSLNFSSLSVVVEGLESYLADPEPAAWPFPCHVARRTPCTPESRSGENIRPSGQACSCGSSGRVKDLVWPTEAVVRPAS